MSARVLCAATMAALLWGGADSLIAQAPAAASSGAAKKAPEPTPRTPWGHPDLQGTWDYRTITPLERPRDLGTREFYTEEEVKALEGAPAGAWTDRPRRFSPALRTRSTWTDPGRFLTDSRRTSLIVDPPDGRIPALTAEGKARVARQPNRAASGAAVTSWLDRGNQERCITYGLPSASLPTLYNNNIQIVQTPDTAAIVHEMIHEARVVPLDGRARLTDKIGTGLDRRVAGGKATRWWSKPPTSPVRTTTAARPPA